MIEAPRKFVEIQRPVFLADVVISAHNPAFEQRPKRLNVVRVDIAAYVFATSMMDGFMPHAATEIVVFLLFVGRHERDLIADDLANEAATRSRIRFADHLADYVALTFNRADDANLSVS